MAKLVWTIVALCVVSSGAVADDVFYVSPNGSDSWSGRIAAPNAARTDGPLASLTGARDAVRKLKSAGALASPVRVIVADGTYQLAEPFVLKPEDSGTASCPVTYEAATGAHPVFSGGRVITGWKPGENGLWTAEVPEVAAGKWCFSQLFVNGHRRTRARTPNEGSYCRVIGRAPLSLDPNQEEVKFDPGAMVFEPGHIRNWPDLEDANVMILHNWESTRLKVKSLDLANSIARFDAGKTQHLDWWLTLYPHSVYYVENLFEALDAPGEWYLNRKTGVLYYKPVPGEDMRKAQAVAPVLSRLVSFAGEPDAGRFVEHIRTNGLTFSHADWSLEAGGHGDWQAALTVEAVLQADGARNCELSNCTISHVGTYGIWFRRGCTDNRIECCEIVDAGAGGVRIGVDRIAQNDAERTTRNVIHSCYIHDCGHVYPGAIGVWIGQSPGNTISHCEICDLQYSGISIGWTWGYGPSDTAGTTTEYNHIHHLGQGILYDMGAIYNLGASPGSRIANNLIHDIRGGGIYPDEGSAQVTIENNVAYRCLNGGLTLHYGKDNTVRNNVFAFSPGNQVVRYRNEPHSAFAFERNIVYHDKGNTIMAGDYGEHETFHHNVYWNCAGRPLGLPLGMTFAHWQASGKDTDSLNVDPLFVDPKRDDFRLKPDSPALKLGFQPIDTSKAGLEGERAWAELPSRTRRKPFKLVAPSRLGQSINDDFELTHPGFPMMDAILWGEAKGATIRVTGETAASGKHSLKFTDAPGLDQPYNPHMWYSPHLDQGIVRGSFDLRLEKGALFVHEWRDDATPYHTGPTMHTDADGNLFSGEKLLTKLPLGHWVHVEVSCDVGRNPSGRYWIAVTLPGVKPQRFDLTCEKSFNRLDWAGFVSNATERTVFYIDNVRIRESGR